MRAVSGGSHPLWAALDSLVASARIVIDRPRRSGHPRRPEVLYPLDYGYLDGVKGGDGAGADVWVGSARGAGVTGFIATADGLKRDLEIKVLYECTPEEGREAEAFHTGGVTAGFLVLRERP